MEAPRDALKQEENKHKRRRTRAALAGLQFPVGRMHRYLKIYVPANIQVRATAAVYIAAVIEYVIAEVCEQAGYYCIKSKAKRITPRHLQFGIRGDEELDILFKGIISGGGVVPHPKRLADYKNKNKNKNKK